MNTDFKINISSLISLLTKSVDNAKIYYVEVYVFIYFINIFGKFEDYYSGSYKKR